ncbi:MAG: undecaprenyl-diphosphate phosphatase, partial [Gammaproteobacteria bacterium]
ASKVTNIYHLNWHMALWIGVAQALALVPGTSRSGITMTAGRLFGIDRPTAARFSFLLAIPVIAGAGLLEILKLVAVPEPVDWISLLAGVTVSAVTAYACIALFLAWIARIGMLPFVIYRVVFGLVLIYLFT